MTTDATALYFGPPERPRFGWLHSSPTANPKRGVVICSPFGYEAICSQRSLRHLADAVAQAGMPALRFDYDGCGDSFGDDREPSRVQAWLASIHDAIDFLRRATGVAEVYVVGQRLGATLGALAAATRTDVQGFVGIAAVVAGKAYLRELRALQMTVPLKPAPPSYQAPEGEREAAGFILSAETQAALTAIDLVKQQVRPAARLLLLDRSDLPANEAWAQSLREASVDVDYERAGDFGDSVLDPHHARVPEGMIRNAVSWMLAASRDAAPAIEPDRTATSRSAIEFVSNGASVRERPVWVDSETRLFGVLSEPASEATGPRKAILLLNAGSIYHIGPNRLHVELARRWAARGYTVLRFDLSGLGESPARRGEPENVVYGRLAQRDVAVALGFLRTQPSVRKVYIVGLCSGAYNGFKAAVAGASVDGIVPINPLTFFWKEGMSLDIPQHRVVEDAQRYSRKVASLEAWKKVLRGKVELRYVAEVMLRHGAGLVHGRARDLGRYLGVPLTDDLAQELQTVAKRGIPMHFVFALGDPGVELLRVQGGNTVSRLLEKGGLRRTFVDGADHTFTARWAQEELVRTLDSVLAELEP